jgi:hypothetical protein
MTFFCFTISPYANGVIVGVAQAAQVGKSSTSRLMARSGSSVSQVGAGAQQLVVPLFTIRPHDGAGGCTPKPKKLRPAPTEWRRQ